MNGRCFTLHTPLNAPFGTIQIPEDFLGLIIEVVKKAERRGARKT